MAKPRATRKEYEVLLSILDVIPFHAPGKTAHEIRNAVGEPWPVGTVASILIGMTTRGWVSTRDSGHGSRYVRNVWNPRENLESLVTIVPD